MQRPDYVPKNAHYVNPPGLRERRRRRLAEFGWLCLILAGAALVLWVVLAVLAVSAPPSSPAPAPTPTTYGPPAPAPGGWRG